MSPRGRVFQVMECLIDGDGVSNVVRGFAPVLAALGAERPILTLHADQALRGETLPFNSVDLTPEDAVIVHLWGATQLEPFLRTFPGRKAIFFHNITPPDFFPPGSVAHRATSAGLSQLVRLVDLPDMWLAPSAYNLACLARSGRTSGRPQHVIPYIADTQVERDRPADIRRLGVLRARREVNFLFVGRLAPNKQQERIMEVFDHYHARINRRSRLHLVGDGTDNPGYARSLAVLRYRLTARDAIEMPGKVKDTELAAYYRSADLFLCLSEHEGFCLPPLVAAAHGVPLIVAAAAALPETVGPAAVLVHRYDPPRIAELAHLILQESPLRAGLAAAAGRHLGRFTRQAVTETWRLALAELLQ